MLLHFAKLGNITGKIKSIFAILTSNVNSWHLVLSQALWYRYSLTLFFNELHIFYSPLTISYIKLLEPYLLDQVQQTVCICSFHHSPQLLFYKHIQHYMQLFQTNKLNCIGLAKPTEMLSLRLLQKTSSERSTAVSILWKAEQAGLSITEQVSPVFSQGSFQHILASKNGTRFSTLLPCTSSHIGYL